MTTYATETVVCGACSHIFAHRALASTNSFGSPDLDTRPPPMRRSTMDAWIARCPSCGFVSRDFKNFDDKFRGVLSSAPYRAQLADTRFPVLASTFICGAMLAEAIGRRKESGWAHLQAAWVLDDAKKDELARHCRSRAADVFLVLITGGEVFSKPAGASEAITVDCLRRAGRGAEALPVLEAGLNRGFAEFINKMLAFQKTLIDRGDTSGHLMEEALKKQQK